MSLAINSNLSSLTAQRSLTQSNNALGTAMQRLSTGLRINSAKDDAAGLAISDRMTSQIRGMNQAARNANDGISMAQTAEGALQEVTNMLQRMRELAVQAASDTNTSADRAAISTEINSMADEIQRVGASTQFNGKNVLTGASAGKGTVNIQVGANTGTTNQIGIKFETTVSRAGLGITAGDVNVSGVAAASGVSAVAAADAAQAAITAIDTAINKVDVFRADLGTAQNRLTSTVNNLQNAAENQAAARSRILDADFAAETTALSKAQILQQAGTAMLAQANQSQQGVLSLLR